MVRYAEQVCDGCGAIYPANEMVHTYEELGSESYVSNSYVTHRGGGQTVYSTFQSKVILCKECAEARKAAPPSKLISVLLKIAGLVMGAVILAPMVVLGLMMFSRTQQTSQPPTLAQPVPRQERSAPPASIVNDAPQALSPTATLAKATDPAPSFDCIKATSHVEQLICSNPDLARADVKLMEAYKQRMALVSPQSQEGLALRQEQRTWLTEERNPCTTADCVAAAYASRTQALGHPIGER
jgi:uncharacterized protein YecT (DUF1311 family)